MSNARNPFTPTFGIVPPHLAGRGELLEAFADAFKRGNGDPNLCTLLVGPRGSGKTALLSCIGDEARKQGWLVVDTVADTGMLEDIEQHIVTGSSHLLEKGSARRLKEVGIGSLSLSWDNKAPARLNWRTRMEAYMDALAERGTGLLVCVDELRCDVDELSRLASVYQLLIRAGHDVALVMAGLPHNVDGLVSDERVSFLRRARQRYLKPVADIDVRQALRLTASDAGKDVQDDALAIAVEASGGFPYLIQLVGYAMWNESAGSPTIDAAHAERGADQARREFEEGVLERTWREMSKGDRAFALSMLPDNHGSTLSEVARRMGKGSNYASTYKKRLLKQGVVGERSGNTFDFDIPLFRDYLRKLL